jgi:hypothetical protein
MRRQKCDDRCGRGNGSIVAAIERVVGDRVRFGGHRRERRGGEKRGVAKREDDKGRGEGRKRKRQEEKTRGRRWFADKQDKAAKKTPMSVGTRGPQDKPNKKTENFKKGRRGATIAAFKRGLSWVR